MPTKTHTTHVGGVLTPKEQTFSATLNNQLNLARISLLVTRNSLLIIPSQLKQLLQVIRFTHMGGVLTPKRRTHSAVLNNQLNLARISLFVTRYL